MNKDMNPIARIRWKFDVRRNRSRHLDLVQQEKNGEDPIVVAQKMLMRDRDAARTSSIISPRDEYPILYDYIYIPISPFHDLSLWWFMRRYRRTTS
jgi:hypothetical protein